jgi:hypothetical protein
MSWLRLRGAAKMVLKGIALGLFSYDLLLLIILILQLVQLEACGAQWHCTPSRPSASFFLFLFYLLFLKLIFNFYRMTTVYLVPRGSESELETESISTPLTSTSYFRCCEARVPNTSHGILPLPKIDQSALLNADDSESDARPVIQKETTVASKRKRKHENCYYRWEHCQCQVVEVDIVKVPFPMTTLLGALVDVLPNTLMNHHDRWWPPNTT